MERMRQQMTTARMVGKIATEYGSRQASKTIRQVIATVTDMAVKPRLPKPIQSSAQAEKSLHLASGRASNDTGSDLAIAHYTTLSAIHIVAQLGFLSADELRTIADFERTHRMRQTILSKIDQLLQT
jgi:hypothetical protein